MTKKGTFLRQLNEAFAKSDTDYITKSVTEDIQWTVHGDFSVQGKAEFVAVLKKMESDEPLELEIKNIITHGDSAAVDGIMQMPGEDIAYAFCDIYTFRGSRPPWSRR